MGGSANICRKPHCDNTGKGCRGLLLRLHVQASATQDVCACMYLLRELNGSTKGSTIVFSCVMFCIFKIWAHTLFLYNLFFNQMYALDIHVGADSSPLKNIYYHLCAPAWLYVYHVHAGACMEPRRGRWSFRQVWALWWVLGPKPASSARAAMLLTIQPAF